MIRLHYSNRLERLVAPLSTMVREQQGRDPLARVTVVVPNRAVEEFVKLRLAESEGIAANLEFPFLRRYLAALVCDADDGVRALEADELRIAVFESLRAELETPEFETINAYVSAGGAGVSQRELRLVQLSARVARLFREYSISRRAMLDRWQRGLAFGDERFAASERCQRHLYLTLFDADRSLRPEWLADRRHRWLLLPDALDAVDRRRLKTALPERLHIFALSYVGPEFVRIFSRLGELTDVHVYALNPCLEFWEDVDASYRVAKARLVHREERIGSHLEVDEDPFKLNTPDDNLALRLWGRPGREYIRLLNELTDCDFDSHFELPSKPAESLTLLERVQQSILLREPEGAHARESIPQDDSIRFLACPGIRREVESAANTIWALIRKDEAERKASPLRFHHIAVLLPDADRDTYLAHIESVFADEHGIPVNIVERLMGAESRVGEAAELLLKLPLSNFSRDEMLHLLTHPAITGALSEADTERWTEWCNSIGVYFGADEREFAGTYIPPAMYHWDQALRRLALGLFMAGEPSGETRRFQAASGCEYLPYETAQDAFGSIATLVRTARALLVDALEARSMRLAPGEWGRFFGVMLNTYVHPPDPASEQVLYVIVRAIESIAPPELRAGPVSYQVASELALERIADAQNEYGRYMESGVVVGTLSALRSLPFSVILALGLGETSFPERERKDPMDLRLVRRQAGDVSAPERDRYLFLETLLAARRKIFLSYIARDEITGEKLEPSAVIRELQLILRSWLDEPALERLTIVHPVSRYDRSYFPELRPPGTVEDELKESFDRNARRGARIVALGENLRKWSGEASLWAREGGLPDTLRPEVREKLSGLLQIVEPPVRCEGEAAHVPELVLPIAALRRFLECPIQGSARYALRMIDEDDDAGDDSTDEPVAHEFLERTMLLRQALWLGRCDAPEMERHYDELFHTAQLRGGAPCGLFAKAARTDALPKLTLCSAQAASTGVQGLAGWQQVRIGGAEEFAQVDRILPAITLEVPMKKLGGDARLRVKLQGRVGPVSPNLDASIRCVAGKEAKTKDFLEGFLGAVALAATGETMPASFWALAVGGDKDEYDLGKLARRFRPLCTSDAVKFLRSLVEDLLGADNHYFLPIEAVEKVMELEAPGPEQIRDAIECVQADERRSCSSDYGPIRNARSFAAPQPNEVLAIITRRFGPIIGIFG